MAKSKSQKVETLADLTDKLKGAKGVVFADFRGLTVKDATALRRQAKKEGVSYVVAKKTLIGLAAKNANLEGVETDKLVGNIGVAVSEGDEVTAARVLSQFKKGKENFKILGGIFERKFVGADTVNSLAALPSKNELLSQVLRVLNGPMTGLVRVLNGNITGLVRVLSQIKK